MKLLSNIAFENKFDEKGNPLFFPGCTIIFNIPIDTDLSSEIFNFQKFY